MDMKKLVVLSCVFAALFSSCATMHKITFDDGLTAETGATVLFNKGINVLTVNGIDVDKAWYGKSFWSDESARVLLPAERIDIVFDLFYVESTPSYTKTFSAKNLSLTLNLETGGQYTVSFIWVKESGFFIFAKGHYGIGVYNKLPNVLGSLSDGDRIEFYPIEFN
jgi:hypothetical protein